MLVVWASRLLGRSLEQGMLTPIIPQGIRALKYRRAFVTFGDVNEAAGRKIEAQLGP